MKVLHTAALIACGLLSACATIVTGNKQVIQVDSNPPGAQVYTAVKPSKWGTEGPAMRRSLAGVTPVAVTIERKDGAIFVEKEGYYQAEVPLERTINWWILGDLVAGSLLSTSIDTSTGAAKRYDPDSYLVELRPLNGPPPGITGGRSREPARPSAPPAIPEPPAPPAPQAVPVAPPPPANRVSPAASEKQPASARTVAGALLRAKADAYSDVRLTLPAGTMVRLVSKLQEGSNVWWYVTTSDERSGWLRDTDLTAAP